MILPELLYGDQAQWKTDRPLKFEPIRRSVSLNSTTPAVQYTCPSDNDMICMNINVYAFGTGVQNVQRLAIRLDDLVIPQSYYLDFNSFSGANLYEGLTATQPLYLPRNSTLTAESLFSAGVTANTVILSILAWHIPFMRI